MIAVVHIYSILPHTSDILILVLISSLVSLLGVAPLDSAGPAAAERGLEREVDVFLAVQTDDEAGDVDDLPRKRRD